MSIGPMGMIGSAAGSPLAQGQGSEVNRAQQETADHARQTQANEKAENASGVGQTEQDEETADRDADGRRLWEVASEEGELDKGEPEQEDATEQQPRGKDPSGQKGGQLDLSG